MLFNSLSFLVFFAIVIGIHYLPLPWRLKKLNLVVASYLFYAAWSPPFVILLWISTLVDWHVARWMSQATHPAKRRALLCISLACNLGLLGYFKYAGFLLEGFTSIMSLAGIAYQAPDPGIILPVGISFYTFQTLSYTIDVYRGRLKPWPSFVDFALFVTFFPQLVAGPIVRAIDFLPQCTLPRAANGKQFTWGISLLGLGLFQKVCIADGLLAPIADKVFAGAHHATTLDAWAGVLAFSGQIFCDFAGYSTCAIGAALCLGFALPDNFRFPYGAIGFSDFWRRWHISLSSWLRDYLYVSLGGNRKGPGRTYVNLMMTMFLGGLWHGAAWTFVVWGGLHGLYLIIERWLQHHGPKWDVLRRWPGQLALAAVTYGAVCFAWVFFRAGSFSDAYAILRAMGGMPLGPSWSEVKLNELGMVAGITVVMFAIHFAMRNTHLEHVAARIPLWLRAAIVGALFILVIAMSGDDRAFIYFQF